MLDLILSFLSWTWSVFFDVNKFHSDIFWGIETSFYFIKDNFPYSYARNFVVNHLWKLILCLVFLSAIRGGVPRYRYDFLTKMGWVKFLSFLLSILLATLLLSWVW